MKQRRHLKTKLSATAVATLLSIALAGTTCGTFAWFTYTTRAKVLDDLEGMTIGVGNLEVGILSEVDLPDADYYGLIKDESNPNQAIYWFAGHEMLPATISYVLSENGYATNSLIPVTSRKYAEGDNLSLFSTPTTESSDEDEKASKEGRIYLPLVFRYADILEEKGDVYLPNQNIALSKVTLSVSQEDSQIIEAVRIFTDNKDDNSHLINPSTMNDGATKVGGLLDLNGDGFYDVDYVDDVPFERLYGQVSESAYKDSPEASDTLPENPEHENAFIAGHKAGVYAVDSFTPELAEYEGFYGFGSKQKWVTTTNPQTNNYAYLDLSLFVEGWDVHVINREIEIPFSIELKFEAIM